MQGTSWSRQEVLAHIPISNGDPLVTVMLVPNTKVASVASAESWYKWADTIPSHDEPTLREPQTILEYLLKRHLGKREESRIIHAMK